MYVGYCCACSNLVIGHREPRAWFDEVDAVVLHLLLVFQGWLGRANVHSFIYLHGIAHHDLGVAIAHRSRHGRVALAACGGAKDDNWFAFDTHLLANSLHREVHFVRWQCAHIYQRSGEMEPCGIFNAHRCVRANTQ